MTQSKAQIDATVRYLKKSAEAGLRRVSVRVPADRVEEIKRLAEAMRAGK